MSRKVFEDFQEFHSLTRILNSSQKNIIYDCLTKRERAELARSFEEGCWQDLFAVNEVDSVLDDIKDRFGIDLVYLRIRILRGDVHKVRKLFWRAVINAMNKYELRYVRHVIEGIRAVDLDSDYVLLIPSVRRPNGEESPQGKGR